MLKVQSLSDSLPTTWSSEGRQRVETRVALGHLLTLQLAAGYKSGTEARERAILPFLGAKHRTCGLAGRLSLLVPTHGRAFFTCRCLVMKGPSSSPRVNDPGRKGAV
jgi:hypothetical protein